MPRTLPKRASKTVETASIPAETPQIVHDVHLLDGSGSMAGDKFNNAVKGINSDLKMAAESSKKYGVGGTCSVYQFSDPGFSLEGYGNIIMQPVGEVTSYNPRIQNGWTALYEAMGTVIEYYIKVKKPNEKVLLKVFTDGQENKSKGIYANARVLGNLINDAQKNHGFTVTFVGTQQDVARITNALQVDASNSLVHDNTASGIAAAFLRTEESSVQYRKSLSLGENVSTNFYGKSMENK